MKITRQTIGSVALAACGLVVLLAQKEPAEKFRDPNLPVEQRVDDLVGRMTLEEKVSQMQNDAPAIARLGVPAYNWWNEGLHGIARSGYATVFPQAIGLAATWDPTIVRTVADTISTEARAKYHQALRANVRSIYYGLTVWSPNINIFRDPRWGRGQETYGEDPYLTGRLGVAFVRGLQGDDSRYLKTVATPKHFAVHSGPESERHRFDVKPSRSDLNGTYLPAFRAAVMEGHADSVMCAYNAVDGVPACGNKDLLETTLRKQWGFTGYVTSDCGAVSDFYTPIGHRYSQDVAHAAAAGLAAGTDTSCGDEYAALTAAVRNKLVPPEAVDRAVKRLFTARFRLGMFDGPGRVAFDRIPFSENDSDAHRRLALEVARKSIVLLKNTNGILPLAKPPKTIAVIGPNAASLAALEGNYNAVPSHPVLPLEGIEQEFGASSKIVYAQGSPYAPGLALPVPRTALRSATANAQAGLAGQYFANSSFQGRPVLRRVDSQIDFDWNSASPAPGLPANDFSVRWTGVIEVPQIGDYSFGVSLAHCFPCSDRESYAIYLDGQQIASETTDEGKKSRPSAFPLVRHRFRDIGTHTIRVDYTHHSALFGAGVTLNWLPPEGSLLPGAAAAAKSADVVIAFVGLSPELEGEEMPVHVEGFAGGDRTRITLPVPQEQMLQTVAATGKPLIVVLMSGSAVALHWGVQSEAALLAAWYPGEAGGYAIAQTLSGKNNPAGRLPVTFYESEDQLPAFNNYAMENRTYRYFNGRPQYRFGFGLSYTRFAYSGMRLSTTDLQAGDPLAVEADVRNTGQLAGDEVVELYLKQPQVEGAPISSLRAIRRIHLAAGESRHLRFDLGGRQLSQTEASGSTIVKPGKYLITLGGGQPVDGYAGLSGSFGIAGSKVLPQ